MNTQRYRVMEGKTFGPGGIHKAGSVVTLDPVDASPFMDKLIPLDLESDNVDADAPITPNMPPPNLDLTNELGAEAEPLREKPPEEIDLAGGNNKKTSAAAGKVKKAK